MGSSGSSSYKAPNAPTPAGNLVPYGQVSSFNPSYVSFLGDTNVPSTGLTPGMLSQIDSGAYQQPLQQAQQQSADRSMLAQLIAAAQQRQPQGMRGQRWQPANLTQTERRIRQGGGAARNSGGR